MQDRDTFVAELIIKYPDLLTSRERQDLQTYKSLVSIGILFGFGMLPYAFYAAIKAR
jgi:hypothetical protein